MSQIRRLIRKFISQLLRYLLGRSPAWEPYLPETQREIPAPSDAPPPPGTHEDRWIGFEPPLKSMDRPYPE